jgi:hypothetical protein
MPLSKDYTVERFVNQVFTDLGIDKNNEAYVTRYSLVNRAQVFTVSLFYDLISRVYMTSAVLNVSGTGKYSVSGSGWWEASISELTFSNISAAFDSDDIGKIAIIRSGSNLYTGIVTGVPTSNAIIISGSGMPVADCTINDFMLSTTIVGSSASISSLRIMRVGMNVKLEIDSTQSKYVEPLAMTDFLKWVGTADSNPGKIVWTLEGDNVRFKKSFDIPNVGTLTIKYPRVPIEVTQDSDYLDLPDGAAIELAMIRMKQIISRLLKIQIPDYSNEVMFIIKSLYQSYGREISFEVTKEKATAMQ